jgi:hypothetical protein
MHKKQNHYFHLKYLSSSVFASSNATLVPVFKPVKVKVYVSRGYFSYCATEIGNH